MLQRTRILLSKSSGRTIVRDPRKSRTPSTVTQGSSSSQLQPHQPPQNLPYYQQQQQQAQPPLPFEPTHQNQQSIGSSMASYAIAGAGVALGFTLVGILFGG
ncbi:hypothetical protein IV203_036122 [Nitzschia inconspicua]|uniref:Uncharacterized protein n=1 Tax=Nitzschia inconspicua TaxID=303405 RepID=A0A9K3K521_9STRA|nr:hypothetical protein IV203_030500 [Nitzschia inconspicua]KAG7361022.1 hypothetical protein IV203_036122 [Nitzschia inconspicua]